MSAPATRMAKPPPHAAAAMSSFRIGAVDDAAEREANAAADRVLRRKCAACEDEERLSRSAADGLVAGDAPAAVGAALAGGGQALRAGDAAFFGAGFGADLSGVRVHDGPAADRAARSVGARAFALGQDVVFARGEYRPGTAAGRQLLAHELAHVAQDRRARALRRQTRATCLGVRILLPDTIIFEGTAGSVTGTVNTDIPADGGPYTISYEQGGDTFSISPWPSRDVILEVSLANRPAAEIATYRAYRDSLAGTAVTLEVVEAPASPPATPEAEQPVAWQFRARPITAEELRAEYGVDANDIPAGVIQRLPTAADRALNPALFGGGFFGPTPMSMVPANSTGIMWTQGHLSLFANPNGSAVIRGYRGNLAWYAGETAFSTRLPGLRTLFRPEREFFTFRLNRGVPGGMENDLPFVRMGGQQVVIYVPRDAEGAAAFAERLRAAEYGGDYRYSPPRPGAGGTEGRMAERLSALGPRPEAVVCTNNCITVPQAEIETAIGGRPRLTLPDGIELDLMTGQPEGGTSPDPYRTGRASDMSRWAEEGALPPGASRIAFTPRAASAVGVIRVGGGLMLIYGAYRTEERLRESYGTPAFRRTVGEEAGAWSFGLLGSALGAGAATAGAAALTGAMGGGVICAPGGPIDLACVAVGAAGGLIGGFVFGTVGALIGGEVAERTE